MSVLLIDGREPVTIRTMVADLARSKGIDVRSNRADIYTFGDYIISYEDSAGLPVMIGIERKEVGDFLTSFNKGRVQKQIEGCRDKYSRAFLLLEGEMRVLPSKAGPMQIKTARRVSKVNPLSIRNYLSAIQLRGVGLITTTNHSDTALSIVGLHTMLEHAKPPAGVMGVPLRLRGGVDIILALATATGIPRNSCGKLLDKLGTIAAIIQASDTDLLVIEGIGTASVDRIRRSLGVFSV